MVYIIIFLISLPIFLILDALWLQVMMPRFYIKKLKHVLRYKKGRMKPCWGGILMTYFFLIVGITFFVIPPLLSMNLSFLTFLYGALFGSVVYGVYEGTNLSTLDNWSVKVVIVDTIWGALVYGFTTFLTVYIAQMILSWYK